MQSTTDWNWFYSTIAQCTAAIVRFIGAFMISKLISKEEEYRVLLNDIGRFITNIDNRVLALRAISWHFDQYNQLCTRKFKSQREILLKLFSEGNTQLNELIPNSGLSKFNNPEDNKILMKERLEYYQRTKGLD